MADLREDSVEVKPSIIMKVDAPPEDNNTITSQGGSTNNSLDQIQNETVRTTPVKPKKPLLASSRLNNSSSNNNPLTMRSSVLCSPKLNSGVVLRPSALGSRLENNKSTDNSKKHSNNGETPKFVPLALTESNTSTTTTLTPTITATSTTNTTTTSSIASTSNFVFGQNLHERVVSESEEGNVSSGSAASTNGTSSSSEMLFSNAQQTQKNSSSSGKSLSESAREYEESRANKRKYEAVTVVTGEEGEQNVLQLHCKLFAYDKPRGSWQERGRGTLRLNDQDTQQSRLVFRTSGSLRVVLNTKIWAEMTVERASDKSLRLTAMDATGQIKVFLIMASGEEVSQLQRLLQARVAQLRDAVASGEPQLKKKH